MHKLTAPATTIAELLARHLSGYDALQRVAVRRAVVISSSADHCRTTFEDGSRIDFTHTTYSVENNRSFA